MHEEQLREWPGIQAVNALGTVAMWEKEVSIINLGSRRPLRSQSSQRLHALPGPLYRKARRGPDRLRARQPFFLLHTAIRRHPNALTVPFWPPARARSCLLAIFGS